jgi:hypothetical protein
VVSRPDGSQATIRYARGTVSRSTPYDYHYDDRKAADIILDMAGQYVVKVSANLLQDDDLYPGKRTASAEFLLTAN